MKTKFKLLMCLLGIHPVYGRSNIALGGKCLCGKRKILRVKWPRPAKN